LYAVWQAGGSPTPTPIVVPNNVKELELKFRDDQYTSFSIIGYGLDEKSGVKTAGFSDYFGVSVNVAIGFRVWIIGEDYEYEVTPGYPVAASTFMASANSSLTGWVYGMWDCPDINVDMGYSALRVVLYTAIDDGANAVARATYISNALMTQQIVGSTWTFGLYVEYTGSTLDVSWSGKYNTAGIGGILIVVPSIFDTMFFKLVTLDIFGFVLYPYINILGAIFYVITLLFVFGAYYIWHGKVTIVLFLLLLFGSAGGLVFLFIPAPGSILLWVFLVIGFAGLLFRVFR